MELQDDQIRFLGDYLPSIMTRRYSASFKDLIGQSDNADTTITGQIGESIQSSVDSGSAVALTSPNAITVTSIVLSPGDWDVWISAYFSGNVATTITTCLASISIVNNTVDLTNGRVGFFPGNNATLFATTGGVYVPAGQARMQLSAATTVYYVARGTFAVNTMSAYGILQARRRRHFPG